MSDSESFLSRPGAIFTLKAGARVLSLDESALLRLESAPAESFRDESRFACCGALCWRGGVSAVTTNPARLSRNDLPKVARRVEVFVVSAIASWSRPQALIASTLSRTINGRVTTVDRMGVAQMRGLD